MSPKHFRPTLLPALLLGSLLFALPAAAQTALYRWVDARGVVNYSSEPPPAGARVQAVTQQPVTNYDAGAALAATERQNRELQARLDRLQREVDELRSRQNTPVAAQTYAPAPAPAPAPATQKTAASACADDPRNNCNRGLAPEFEYPYQGVVVRTVPVYVLPPTPVHARPHPHQHQQVSPHPHRGFQGNRSGLSLNIRYGG